jgi:phosphoribosylglycinamide formyltransferase-1
MGTETGRGKGLVVLISGRGSNMRSLVEAGLPVRAVIANRTDAAGLAWARERGIATACLDHRQYPDRAAFDAALAQAIDAHEPAFVVLAGFMRILTAAFVEHYAARLVNIHPSILPAFTGLHTHERAIEAGVKCHGATVHLVTAELDHGPIIIQAVVPVEPDDDADRLAGRVLAQEHRIFPLAVRWLLEGNLDIREGQVRTRDGAAQVLFAATAQVRT